MNLEDVDIKIGRSMRISVEKSAWNYVLDSVKNSVFLRNSVYISMENSVRESVNTGLQELIRREREQG